MAQQEGARDYFLPQKCDQKSADVDLSLQHCGVKSQSEISSCNIAKPNLKLRFDAAILQNPISG